MPTTATAPATMAMVNVRMPRDVKDSFEDACESLGMSMTTAVNVFARAVARERRIPFEVTADPFYSEENMAHLRRSIAQVAQGRAAVHDLVGDDDD